MILNSSLRENLLYGTNREIDNKKLIDIISEFKLFNEENSINLNKAISNKMLSTDRCKKFLL